MSRTDPKPGRWILPLVVVGIIAFTWVFVNALPPAPDATSGGTLATTTTRADGTSSTTTSQPVASSTTTTSTTIPPEIVQFINSAETVAEQAGELLAEAQEINETWETGRNFTLALNNFRDFADRTAAFADGVENIDVPDQFLSDWDPVEAAAAAMALAADDMVRGLQAPDTGQIRRAALADVETAVTDLIDAIDAATEAAGA